MPFFGAGGARGCKRETWMSRIFLVLLLFLGQLHQSLEKIPGWDGCSCPFLTLENRGIIGKQAGSRTLVVGGHCPSFAISNPNKPKNCYRMS